ncbi:MAG: dipeptide ABC transporter permease DppC, partial [Rhodoferax sp.]|nr:dipeptide ABC transporter permease DppC [Rhodoferax sp.]
MAAPDALAPAAASAHAEAAVPLATGRSLWRRLLGHKLFVTGIILFGIVLAMALFADLLATAAPEKMNVRARFRTPEWQFLLGTDNYGRDIWSRLTHGARLSLSIGFAVVLATGVAGTLIGLLAG